MSTSPYRVKQGPSYQPESFIRLVPRTAPAQGRDAIQVLHVISAFGTGTAAGQGAESAQLSAAFIRLRADSADTVGNLWSSAQHSEELTYNPIPIKPAFSVQATYKFVGKLKPRPFPIDE